MRPPSRPQQGSVPGQGNLEFNLSWKSGNEGRFRGRSLACRGVGGGEWTAAHAKPERLEPSFARVWLFGPGARAGPHAVPGLAAYALPSKAHHRHHRAPPHSRCRPRVLNLCPTITPSSNRAHTALLYPASPLLCGRQSRNIPPHVTLLIGRPPRTSTTPTSSLHRVPAQQKHARTSAADRRTSSPHTRLSIASSAPGHATLRPCNDIGHSSVHR